MDIIALLTILLLLLVVLVFDIAIIVHIGQNILEFIQHHREENFKKTHKIVPCPKCKSLLMYKTDKGRLYMVCPCCGEVVDTDGR